MMAAYLLHCARLFMFCAAPPTCEQATARSTSLRTTTLYSTCPSTASTGELACTCTRACLHAHMILHVLVVGEQQRSAFDAVTVTSAGHELHVQFARTFAHQHLNLDAQPQCLFSHVIRRL